MESYTGNVYIADPDYEQSAYREKGNTETYHKAWNLNLARKNSLLKGLLLPVKHI